MRSPAVLRGGGSRLLPAGRPHPVQELQRSPHPGPLSQNLHWLLIRLLEINTHLLKLPLLVGSSNSRWAFSITDGLLMHQPLLVSFHSEVLSKLLVQLPHVPQWDRYSLAWPAGSLGSTHHLSTAVRACPVKDYESRRWFICRKAEWIIISMVLWPLKLPQKHTTLQLWLYITSCCQPFLKACSL